MAVIFELPAELTSPLGLLLPTVECVLKATAFVCLVSARVYLNEECLQAIAAAPALQGCLLCERLKAPLLCSMPAARESLHRRC
jgi:hypothetical protein